MNIPTTKPLSDAERFCIGLSMIADECNINGIKYNGIGVLEFRFKDGSSVGGIRAAIMAGLINEDEYREHYE